VPAVVDGIEDTKTGSLKYWMPVWENYHSFVWRHQDIIPEGIESHEIFLNSKREFSYAFFRKQVFPMSGPFAYPPLPNTSVFWEAPPNQNAFLGVHSREIVQEWRGIRSWCVESSKGFEMWPVLLEPQKQVCIRWSTVSSPTALGVPREAEEDPLFSLYEADDWNQVVAFLSANPYLRDLLLKAIPEIERHFGQGTKVSLELLQEPDAPGQTELFALIHTTLRPEFGLRLLDVFDEEWWLDRISYAQGKLNFSLRND